MSTRARLGIDLDECVFRYFDALRPYAAEALGVDAADIDTAFPIPRSYSLVESGWFKSDEQFYEIHGLAVEQGLYRNLAMIEGASDTLWRLNDEGFHLHIITSRFVNHKQHFTVVTDTAFSLDKDNIPFRGITFDGYKTEHNADVYLDDSPKNIFNLRAAGKQVIIFDAPYNQDIEGARVHDWDEAYAMITEMFPEAAQEGALT